MNDIKSFTFYSEYYELIDNLKNDKEKGEILIAIFDYVFKDKKTNLKGLNQAIFNNLKRPIDKSKSRSRATLNYRQTNKINNQINNQNGNQNTNQNGNQIDNQNDVQSEHHIYNVNVNVNNKRDNKNNRGMGEEGEEEKKRTSFQKPTLEEIRKYCQERANKVNPETFYDFYESKGWMVGKNKMKDWKASVRTWERTERNTQSTSQPKKFQQYSQREYENYDDFFDEIGG